MSRSRHRLFLLLLVGLVSVNYRLCAQKRAIDSILVTSQADTLKLNILLDNGFDHAVKGEAAAIAYVNAVYKLIGRRETSTYLNLKSQANNALGTYYMFTGKYAEAAEAYARNLALGKRINDQVIVAKAYGNLGNLANNQGDYKKAVTYLLRTMKYAESSKDLPTRYYTLSNLANSYIRLKQYDKAILSLEIAIPFAVKNKDQRFEANLYNSLATAYDDAGKPDAAITAHLRSYTLSKAMSNDKGIGSAALNLGNSYTKRKQYKLAEKYIRESIVSARRIGDVQNLAEAFLMLSGNTSRNGNGQLALQFADSALSYNQAAGDRHLAAVLYQNKASTLSLTGNYRSAYNYLERARRLNDSVLNTTITQQVAEMEIKYETEKKERENQKLMYDNRLQTFARERAERDRNLVLFSSLAGIAILLLGFMAFYRYKTIRNRHKQDQDLNRALFEGEQKERIRIARDLHDSIGQLLSVVKMNLSVLSSQYTDGKLKKTEVLVDNTIGEIRTISHNLIPEELNFGLFAAIEGLCEKINDAGTTKVITEIPDEARKYRFEKTNELTIYRIVQEVMSNMVRHAQATEIIVNVQRHTNQLIIAIKDNGKGFDPAAMRESTGLGWKNIAARVNLLDGNMHVRSERLNGTQIEITIPANDRKN